MNELQKVEFELLKQFVSVCNKLNLRYYLVCGSCLGAVKFKGFIPWDDDIDVALPRVDYDIFCNKAKEFLPSYYFLQNYSTDKLFPLTSSKLRDIRTTFIEIPHRHIDICHGVYIDVFPLDGVPSHPNKTVVKLMRKCEIKRKVNLEYNRFSKENIKGLKTNGYFILSKLFPFLRNTQPAIRCYDTLLKNNQVNCCAIWGIYHENQFYPAEYYSVGAKAVFESIQVIVPSRYNEYLTQRYGDWHADIPNDQKVGHHYAEVIDLKRSYTCYLQHLKNGRTRIRSKEEVEQLFPI